MVDFAPIPDPNASTQHLKVQIPKVQVLLEYEEGCEHVATVCVRSGLQVKVVDWSQSVSNCFCVCILSLCTNCSGG